MRLNEKKAAYAYDKKGVASLREKAKGLVMIHCAVFMMGLAGLFARFIDLSAAIIVLGRVFFAALSLGLILKAKGTKLAVKDRRDLMLLICSGAVIAFHWTTFFLSVKVSTVAIAVITFSTFPLFLTFIEPLLFREKIRMREIALAVIMLAGVLILAQGTGGGGMARGIVYGMCSSLSYAVLSLMNRKFAASYSGMSISFFQQITATVLLLPFLFFERPVLNASNLALLALLGVVFTGIAHSLYISGLKTVSGRSAGMIAGLESVYGIAAAAALLAEYPSAREIAGGAVVLGAALISSWYSSQE